MIRRGVKNAIWELEYLVKNAQRASSARSTQPEDDGPLNDPRMWPFYEKALRARHPAHDPHGHGVRAARSRASTRIPSQLDDVCSTFPGLKIIAYHMGWPYHEELIGLAGKHPNLYLSLSGIIGWFARAP